MASITICAMLSQWMNYDRSAAQVEVLIGITREFHTLSIPCSQQCTCRSRDNFGNNDVAANVSLTLIDVRPTTSMHPSQTTTSLKGAWLLHRIRRQDGIRIRCSKCHPDSYFRCRYEAASIRNHYQSTGRTIVRAHLCIWPQKRLSHNLVSRSTFDSCSQPGRALAPSVQNVNRNSLCSGRSTSSAPVLSKSCSVADKFTFRRSQGRVYWILYFKHIYAYSHSSAILQALLGQVLWSSNLLYFRDLRGTIDSKKPPRKHFLPFGIVGPISIW